MTHCDILGTHLKVGDVVAVPSSGKQLKIATINKLTPKMVRATPARGGKINYWHPHNVIKIDDHQATLYLMK